MNTETFDNDHDEMVTIETPDQGVPEVNNDTTNEELTLPGSENVRSHIVNTETVHMYSISVTRKCAPFPTLTGRVWSWVMSSFSLLLVCSQMIILLSLLTESDFSTCTSHTDCLSGLFCDANIANELLIEPRYYYRTLIFINNIHINIKHFLAVSTPWFHEVFIGNITK